jgi:hypothetical protein
MRCVQRTSVLRCAFCHDDADAPEWSCGRCATRLHEDCFELAGVCPILGCAPRLRVLVLPLVQHAGRASPWHLAIWLATFTSVWATLVWPVPEVTKDLRTEAPLAAVADRGAHGPRELLAVGSRTPHDDIGRGGIDLRLRAAARASGRPAELRGADAGLAHLLPFRRHERLGAAREHGESVRDQSMAAETPETSASSSSVGLVWRARFALCPAHSGTSSGLPDFSARAETFRTRWRWSG